jgi:sugar lactone lactonase YvrE
MRVAAVTLAVLAVTCAASSAARVHVSLSSRPPALVTGKAWTAKLAVRPKSFAGAVRVQATGPGRVSARATGAKGSYRARLVFPQAGRWTLSAHAGGSTSRLGAVTVRRRAEPLVFASPTSVAIEPTGTLLVVENGRGRVLRIDPSTGAQTVVASGLSRPYDVTTTPGGDILLSTESTVIRLGTGEVIASADRQIGRVVPAPNGDVYFATATTAYRVPAGTHEPALVADGLAAPHGLALTRDGALLIADTESDRILRVDPSTGAVTTLARLDGGPGDLVVAADGTLYVCEMTSQRVLHLTASGQQLGFVGSVFAIPYALAVDAGGVYVVEAETSGHIKHVASDGSVTTLARGGPAGR